MIIHEKMKMKKFLLKGNIMQNCFRFQPSNDKHLYGAKWQKLIPDATPVHPNMCHSTVLNAWHQRQLWTQTNWVLNNAQLINVSLLIYYILTKSKKSILST